MRCPECNKFAAEDTDGDPEVNSLEVDEEGLVTAEVRIVNCCAECSTELKESTLEMESSDACQPYSDHLDALVEEAMKAGVVGKDTQSDDEVRQDVRERLASEHALDVEEGSVERLEDLRPPGAKRPKKFYGATLGFTVKCSCGNFSHDGSVEDYVQASGMDEMV